MIAYEAKRRREAPDGDPRKDLALEDEEAPRRPPRIRCPQCAWQPRADSRWYCTHCGHRWNTFDTAGRCPGCAHQWRDTKCLACRAWSLHVDWYEAPTGQPPR